MIVFDKENPDIINLFIDLFDTLLEESDRGAIIIGATKVEEQLSLYIQSILPKSSATYRKKLLKYPGILSSFNSKIELAYAFRLIDKKLYASLNSLRILRNKAAHSPTSLSISDLTDQYEKIFDLGSETQLLIKNQSKELIVKAKFKHLKSLFEEWKLTDQQQEEQVKGLLESGELIENLEKQVPKWELVFGLTILCSFMKYEKEETLELLGQSDTWFIRNLKSKNKVSNP